MDLYTALSTAGFYCVLDDAYKPRADPNSKMVCVTPKRTAVQQGEDGVAWREIRITGALWFDGAAKRGNRGAVSLIMHLRGLKFVDAVRLLAKGLAA
jgi:hypothetical protein